MADARYERHRRLLEVHARSLAAQQRAACLPAETDEEALRAAHRFLRPPDEVVSELPWGERLAARYYARLFKEYGIADLSRAREGRLGLRWRTEAEVRGGKGQFSCGAKRCERSEELATYEVPFAFTEVGEEQQALVKLRLCTACAEKLMEARPGVAKKKERPAGPQGGAKRRRREADDGAAEAAFWTDGGAERDVDATLSVMFT